MRCIFYLYGEGYSCNHASWVLWLMYFEKNISGFLQAYNLFACITIWGLPIIRLILHGRRKTLFYKQLACRNNPKLECSICIYIYVLNSMIFGHWAMVLWYCIVYSIHVLHEETTHSYKLAGVWDVSVLRGPRLDNFLPNRNLSSYSLWWSPIGKTGGHTELQC